MNRSMEEMIRAYRSSGLEERIKILSTELDQELERLYSAMNANSEEVISECKNKLARLRKEMIMLEVF